MTTHREGIFIKGLWVEKGSMPEEVPAVPEVGCTSAPLLSMSYFFSAACKDYSEDFVLCKKESGDPRHCLKEGRRVTRCALDLIAKLKANCDETWTKHWECLDANNQRLQKCRPQERAFNECVFTKLGLSKSIPDSPEGQPQIHLKENPIFK
ncbi:ndufa8, NADH-ubiquinone oxidoreductase complex I 19kd subunit [Polyrhizophydium stewartii]|uniref:NADH-ubiquinone oxidoreductase n=1 Tax=Polyrhizophydium stewartii TaxID=2732419 RepID=A0ABR4NGA7_9FUNG